MYLAQVHFGLTSVDRNRGAKHQALAILNAKNAEERERHYRILVTTTEEVVAAARRCQTQLEALPAIGSSWTQSLLIEDQLAHFLPLVEQVLAQTKRRVFLGETVPASEKIVSLFEEHTDIIKKERRETCFGHKLLLATGRSGLITDLVVLDGNPADSTLATLIVDRHTQRFGAPPRQVAFDGGFASKHNLQCLKDQGVCDVAFAKKRGLTVAQMAKSTWVYKKLTRFRAGIEAVISYAKRCFGLRRCIFKGHRSFACYAWAAVISLNLMTLARRL